MIISQSTFEDIGEMLRLYDLAIEYQKIKFNKHWQPFERKLIETEITEGRQWKILDNASIACIFAVAYSDPFIWGEKSKDPAMYIHRIVTNPVFRGNNYVRDIVVWAKTYGKVKEKKYIRMDTWGDNQKLIDYYVQCGFTFLGLTTPANTENLPKHYTGVSLSLFEILI